MAKLYIDGKLVDCTPQAKAFVDKISSVLGVPILAPPAEYPATFAACESLAACVNSCTVTITPIEPTPAERLHDSRECRTLPTYFCPHCAREAMALAVVEVADPNG